MKKLLLFLMLSLLTVNAFAVVIEFDTPPLGVTGSRLQSYYQEDGVEFRAMGATPYAPILGFGYTGTQVPRFASNDSLGYISANFLRINMADNSLFSLGTVSLAEYSTVRHSSRNFIFTGHYADGSTTSQTFVTDGLIDGIGGIDDFETFAFSSAFNDLAYVTLRSPSYVSVSIDDLVVNPITVPEPSILSLFLLGSLGIVTIRRKKNL